MKHLILLISFVFIHPAQSKEIINLKSEITSYGLWKFTDELSIPEQNQVLDTQGSLSLLKKTKVVPSQVGKIFIFKYKIYGQDGTYKISMVQWHPKKENSKITLEKIVQESDFTIENGVFEGYWGHTLVGEKDHVPGERRCVMYQGGKKIIEFSFDVE